MNHPTIAETSSTRAERTRAAILAAAEDLFAQKGFAAARLEDVADTVQMTRAALFYYYKDKQALYDAMFEDAFGPLRDEFERIIASDHGVAERIEMAAAAWVDAIVARPTLARLLMRFVADGPEPHIHGIFSDNDQITMRFLALFEEGRGNGELKPLDDNFFLVASSVIGTAVFYVGALAMLVPQEARSAPLDAEQAEGLKKEVLRSMRHLLGIAEKKKPTPQNKKTTTRRTRK